jgi:hypothetical protein
MHAEFTAFRCIFYDSSVVFFQDRKKGMQFFSSKGHSRGKNDTLLQFLDFEGNMKLTRIYLEQKTKRNTRRSFLKGNVYIFPEIKRVQCLKKGMAPAEKGHGTEEEGDGAAPC